MQTGLSKKQWLIITIIGLIVLIAFFVFSIISQENKLEVIFFDVGQGSSIFIETPSKNQVLIDGGPDNLLILEHLGSEMPFWDRNINLIISTHSSADHLTGLIEVLRRYNVDKVIWTGMKSDSLTHQQFIKELQKAEARGTKVFIAQFGQKIYLEPAAFSEPHLDRQEIYLKILNPLISLKGKDPTNHNNNSIVSRLSFNQVSFLFTADIEEERELLLIQKQNELKQNFLSADILKIPHHGSKTSSNLRFLEAVKPEKAIIQVGRNNRFGHPHQEVIDRLNQKEIDIFRTDTHGTIKITSNGEKYKINRR